MNRLAYRLAAALLAASASLAYARSPQSVSATLPEGGTAIVTAVSDNVIKVSYTEPGRPERPSALPAPSAQPAAAKACESGSMRLLSTPSGLTAILNAANGTVTIDGGEPDKVVTAYPAALAADGKQQLRLLTTATGSFYGAGERGHKLNLRGDTLTMYNRQNYGYGAGDPRISQMNISMPLLLSSDGFALLFDDYAAATLVTSEGAEITYTTESDANLAFYYVNGPDGSLASVVTELSSITGRQPLPPLWALGYITSKYGYRTQAETLGVIDTLKRAGYPVDGIVLDLYWYGKEQDMGRLALDPEQWPDPKGMLAKLQKKGVNLVAISQPYLLRNGRGAANYEALAAAGMLVADSTGTAPQPVTIWVGEGGMFDPSNPDTRRWLAARYDSLTRLGIAGWWGDLGEPEVHPEGAMHHNGLDTRQYHNKYGNDWSEIVYDMMRTNHPDKRIMTMMRGGTTGLQRFGVFPWSTDVSRSWQGLSPQVTIMQGSGLSGLGYMGHDVGGFAVDPAGPRDAELYVRWLQLGLFSPMLRTHAQQEAEPYKYPEYADVILDLVKQRYRWLPYNYTLAYENALYGYPLVRPLNFDGGTATYDSISDEFLWGSEVLVAPVMQPGAKERSITFPAGSEWIDMAKPEQRYAGGTTVAYPAPLSTIPLFVRAGSFIPMADYRMQNTGDYDPARLSVYYYPRPGASAQYTLYDDDRLSPTSLADGQYRLVTFSGDAASITIQSEGGYRGAPSAIDIEMVVCGLDSAPTAAVTVDGKAVKSTFSGGQLRFKLSYRPGQTTRITL